MASILDLPLELLDNVSIHLLPNSLVPFVLSCKAIYLSSAHIIARHNAYVASWRHVSHDALYILHEIAHDPVIARYVESLRLHDRPNIDMLAYARSKESMEKIIEMVVSNPVLQDTIKNSEDFWPSELRDDNGHDRDRFNRPFSTTTALLWFLPNLKQFRQPEWFEVHRPMGGLVCMLRNRLIVFARNPASLKIAPELEERSLASLETLTPYSSTDGIRTVLQDVEPFMKLPKLYNVYSVSGIASNALEMNKGIPWRYWRRPYCWMNTDSYSSDSMPLRRLEIVYGNCNKRAIGGILSQTPHLEVFKYSHQNRWDGNGIAWDCGAFVAEVEKWVGNALRDLAINVDNIHNDYSGVAPDFTAFEHLEKLEVDASVLIGDTEMLLSHCLQYLLPGSIKTLIINLNKPDLGLVAMLVDGFKASKEILFPELETVVMRVIGCDEGNEKDFEDVRQVVEDEGIEWELLSKERFDVISWQGQICK
ncbi:hypothetical protein K505DRAFT_319978 [Melanomma pulvis-pyrius CBS 109.77]|uniref:Uncharacterized protein n=1 Tax=Melanomma pulvis-pyrius CBS 109.77 TaxID=1314802 RepID=A0A6A6XZQ7_9PLEO|nr:hypothetical protein K505DRAFT_319978 [Melanomma pulvis-pyrius CBS 109.77]